MTQELHIPNLNTLIAHLEAQPPERINMAFAFVEEHECGACGCIAGHARIIWPQEMCSVVDVDRMLGLTYQNGRKITHPDGWGAEENGVVRYPAHRVISTLKRLRDHYLTTGEVVVDWGAEPTAGEPWSAPQAVEQLTAPELPEEITRLLAPKSETVGAA